MASGPYAASSGVRPGDLWFGSDERGACHDGADSGLGRMTAMGHMEYWSRA